METVRVYCTPLRQVGIASDRQTIFIARYDIKHVTDAISSRGKNCQQQTDHQEIICYGFD